MIEMALALRSLRDDLTIWEVYPSGPIPAQHGASLSVGKVTDGLMLHTDSLKRGRVLDVGDPSCIASTTDCLSGWDNVCTAGQSPRRLPWTHDGVRLGERQARGIDCGEDLGAGGATVAFEVVPIDALGVEGRYAGPGLVSAGWPVGSTVPVDTLRLSTLSLCLLQMCILSIYGQPETQYTF